MMRCDPLGLFKILGAFVLCSIIGWFLWRPPSNTRALIFVAYNDNAEKVDAYITWGSVVHQPTGDDCKWEQIEGAKHTVSVEPADTKRYGPKRDLALTWMSQEEYAQWLHKDFVEMLKRRHASLTKWQPVIDRAAGHSGRVTFLYPALIEAN